MRLLVTRPLPEAERTASGLHARGHDAVFAPMLDIQNIRDVSFAAGPVAAILMTSGNAARALSDHPQRETLTKLRCFAVGGQTADAARQAGFSDVVSADGDGGDLAKLVSQQIADRALPLLYVAGSDRARDMAAELSPGGLRVETAVVYQANAAKEFAPDIAAALAQGDIDGALHFSKRSTMIFVDCARAGGLLGAAARLKHFCLSARAAEPLLDTGAEQVFTAATPDESAMLDLISKV